MKPADIDRVFGRGRLRMVTGAHVEVFREESLPGERRRYTKRFLATAAGDFRQWTEREWRILARLVGHGIGPVPDVVQFDRGAYDRPALVQTYDAGITVDHWATLLPVERGGSTLRHAFEDCAHWWALARHCLIALDAIHQLQLVHLDLKADNVCIPAGPADFDPHVPGQPLRLSFEQIALIDFAFSLVSGEALVSALPIARQTEYDYQSPRLLRALEAGGQGNLAPTRQLDWRCDIFSLAAMLRRYLPDPEGVPSGTWTEERHAQARALVRRLLEVHDADLPAERPHAELIALASQPLQFADLSESLHRGWTLATESPVRDIFLRTPVTRVALPIATGVDVPIMIEASVVESGAFVGGRRRSLNRRALRWTAGLLTAAAICVPVLGEAWLALQGRRVDAGGPSSESNAGTIPDRPPTRTPKEVGTTTPGTVLARTESASVSAQPTTPGTAPASSSMAGMNASGPPAAVASAAALASVSARDSAPSIDSPASSASTPAVAAASESAQDIGSGRAPDPTSESPSGKPGASPVSAADPRAALPTAAERRSVGRGSHARMSTAVTRTARVAAASPTARGHERARPRAPARPAIGLAAGAAPSARTAPAASRHVASAATLTSPMATAAQAGLQAPTPWPFTAMARGTASLKQPADSRAATKALPGATMPTPVAPAEPRAAQSKDFMARADDLLANQIPRIAQRAERSVLRVLFVASRSDDSAQDDEIRNAASAMRQPPDDALMEIAIARTDARLLNEAARVAFSHRSTAQEAAELQTRAFGANPADPEIVGNLAFMRLKQHPAQPDVARQLVLHALTLQDARFPFGRVEDWTTLAIASALSGRDRDARNAWFVTLALAPSVQRQCRAATDAYAIYGERLRTSVESMLYRMHASGRFEGSAFCSWPPYWTGAGSVR